MPRIIAVCNQKGGVGKTTTVINIGACLAKLGKRVLLVDVDPQANCTSGVGVNVADLKQTLYEVLVQPNKFKIFRMEDVVMATRWPNLDLVPGHPDLSGAELHLVRKIGRETLLRKNLEPVCRPYDFVLIDTPPSLSLLTINALTAAQEVLIPSRAEPWSLDGIENLLDTIDAIREELSLPLQIIGVVVTVLHERAKLSAEIIRRVEEEPRLSGKIMKKRIRRNIKLVEAADRGTPIVHLAPESHGARAFMSLARELAGIPEPVKKSSLPPPPPVKQAQEEPETAPRFDLVPVTETPPLLPAGPATETAAGTDEDTCAEETAQEIEEADLVTL
jgi:chromosome partitioning protein